MGVKVSIVVENYGFAVHEVKMLTTRVMGSIGQEADAGWTQWAVSD